MKTGGMEKTRKVSPFCEERQAYFTTIADFGVAVVVVPAQRGVNGEPWRRWRNVWTTIVRDGWEPRWILVLGNGDLYNGATAYC